MRPIYAFILVSILLLSFSPPETAWIRINLLGYKPMGVKVAVWCAKTSETLSTFELVDASTQKVVFTHTVGKPFGAYGPFIQTYRLDFSSYKKAGRYFLRSGNATSVPFSISD